MAYSPDGRWLATSDGDGVIRLCEPATGKVAHLLRGRGPYACGLVFSPDGRRLFSTGGGWQEPGQRPEFEEITVVLRGMLRVEHEGGALDVHAGQAVVTAAGEWVRYSTPGADGAEYIAVCLPAFSPASVHRDE